MSRLVLRDLAVVVTVDPTDSVLRDVSVVVEGGVITEIGEVEVRDGDEILDGRGRLALPGLVNLHTHLPMTLLRGIAEAVDLQGFLQRVWAAEGAVMDPATVELGATLGALESLLGGCTTQLDMYFHHEAAHRGAVAAGARHVGGPTFFSGPGPDGLSWDERMAGLRAWPDVLREVGGPEVPVAAMPHATYTNSVEHLAEVASVLAELTPSGVLHTHASENAAENADLLDRVGATPTELLARAGWMRPREAGDSRDTDGGAPRVVLGHGVHLTDDDRATAAAAGAAVAHCPASNLKLASGALDWQRWRADGIRLGIGTDGCASSNDLDMWQAMRQAAHLAALTSGHPEVDATQVLRAATIEGAAALGLDSLVGSLEVGKRADLALLDLDQPHLTPVHDVPALLVHAAGRGDVTDVLVDGIIVVRERRSTQVDTPELLHRCRARAREAATAAHEVEEA
ncbi:N-ethylammeline chlorohydrolase [Knoellia flava TL1]|uniref:S-adenosylhomocysteine deaminase n=2 Tax=Knoellia flava TaxID=913969 RepID=A0A8H9FUR7_9MICO|nr:amidohydrolase family protein [Knoellia flava]KGN32729.1 N-ethylammeline chlorohydrolase [Knoellia flava TL1]GGB87605.1 S-adenosylhomocysteine deaminase [Knoellia flava]